MAGGLGQLLELFYKLSRQHSIQDVEFPVLGKRAIDLRRDYAQLNPADLLDDVSFDLVGLHSLRTNGLKATGLQAFANSMAPFIMANPGVVNQPLLMHKFAHEFIGPDDADEIVRVPTPVERMRSQDEENEGLIQGTEIEVDDDDNHKEHMQKMEPLYQRALDPKDKMPWDVKRVVVQHYLGHLYGLQRKQAQEAVKQSRMPQQQEELPPEAGGTQGQSGSSPMAGGMSDAMTQLGGQTSGENPGPADTRKSPRPGGAKRPMDQQSNFL